MRNPRGQLSHSGQALLPPDTLLRLLPLRDVAPYALNEVSSPKTNSPAAYLNIPYLPSFCPMLRLKGSTPLLDDLLYMLRDFLGRLNELKVGYLELLEFLAGIPEILVRSVVELHQRSGLCINEHNGICPLLEERAVSLLRLLYPPDILEPRVRLRQNLRKLPQRLDVLLRKRLRLHTVYCYRPPRKRHVQHRTNMLTTNFS